MNFETHFGKSRPNLFKEFVVKFKGFGKTFKGFLVKFKNCGKIFKEFLAKFKDFGKLFKEFLVKFKGFGKLFKEFLVKFKDFGKPFKGRRTVFKEKQGIRAGQCKHYFCDGTPYDLKSMSSNPLKASGRPSEARIQKANNASKHRYSSGFF